jgi:hypothetical protein
MFETPTEMGPTISGEVPPELLAKEILKKFHEKISGRFVIRSENESVEYPVGDDFPNLVENIPATAHLGGSSDVRAGVFDGKVFVVKKARESVSEDIGKNEINTEQLVDEYIADRIYEAMGFYVPESKVYGSGLHKVSKFIPGKDLNTFSSDGVAFGKIKGELQEGFVLDCLLANWDVIGTAGGDNIRLGDDGKVYRLDNGGALRFRAKGARKGDSFGEEVGELETMKRNELFSDISNDEIKRQIEEIVAGQDRIFVAIDTSAKQIDLPIEALDDLKVIIRKRLEYLTIYLGKLKGDEKRKKTDRGSYESIVTNNYFEGWDELEVDGNAGIKDTIRNNIIRAEQMNQSDYERVAVSLGITVEELKTELQRRVEDMVAKADFFRATDINVLERVMNVDGRWMSQFETGSSDGTLNPRFRAKQELNMFGYNATEAPMITRTDDRYGDYGDDLPRSVIERNKEKRPIYGYFSDDIHGVINYEGNIPPPNSVNCYGNINFKIKKERALKKATITFHDSLDYGRDWPPTPAAKPHFTSFNCRYFPTDRGDLESLQKPSQTNWGESYTEVQYHGQLTMDDVESIHISTYNDLTQEDVQRVRTIFSIYKQQHPESTIQLIEF